MSEDTVGLTRALDKNDVGKIIGVNGRQAKFIKNHSKLDVFSINDQQEYTNWGRTWVNIYMRGTTSSIQTALLLIESTLKSYVDRQLQDTREQLEQALVRCQELEEDKFLRPLED